LLLIHVHSEDPDIRWLAANVIAAEAPRSGFARQAMKGVKDALAAVSAIQNLDETDPSTGHVNFKMTRGEVQYQRYVAILEGLQIENLSLHEMAGQLEARARDTVLLALAFRNDTLVHDEIVKLVQDSDAGMFRLWAASALEKIGTAADLPMLRRLATGDPLEREGGGVSGRSENSRYPVREGAKQAIDAIQRKVELNRTSA
jgi:HEAT repeat protein